MILTAFRFPSALAAFLITAGGLLSGCRQVSAQVILNGSFEDGALPSAKFLNAAAGSSAIAHWAVGGAGVDILGSFAEAGEGKWCVDLSMMAAGTLSQRIPGFEPGKAYKITFLMAGNADRDFGGNNEPIKKMTMSIGSTSKQFTFDIRGHTLKHMGWIKKEFGFVAEDAVMTLTLTSLENNYFGAVVDNFVLSPADTPAN